MYSSGLIAEPRNDQVPDAAGTEAVYVIKGNRARVLAKGGDLGRPDGLFSKAKARAA